MALNVNHNRRRTRRGASVDAPHGFWTLLAERVAQPHVLARLGLCLAAAIVILLMLRGWEEPFPFRLGWVPPRGIVSRVAFERPDPEATRTAQERAAAKVRVVYTQDKAPVVRLRDGLKNRAAEIAAAEKLAGGIKEAWLEFAPVTAATLADLSPDPPVAPEPPPSSDQAAPAAAADAAGESSTDEKRGPAESERTRRLADAELEFQKFRGLIDTKDKLLLFDKSIDLAFQDLLNSGVLEKIQHAYDEGSQNEIDVHPIGNAAETTRVQVSDVVLVEAKARLKTRLRDELGEGPFVDRVYAWLEPRLSGTLEIDRDGTDRAKREAIAKTPPQFVRYALGDVLAEANVPVSTDEVVLLRREHDEYLRQRDTRQRLARTLSMLGLCAAMFALSGFYIHLHHRHLLDDISDVVTLLGLSVVTVVLCMLSAHDAWQAEIVPLLVFAMTVAIAYDEDLALLFTAQVALVVVVGLGWGLAPYITLTSAAAAMIFWMGRIRSRSKLIYVGLWAGAVATLTQLGTGLLDERSFDAQMLYEAGRTGIWTLLAGFLMTGLLPFIERTFGVLTDLSLLEVGDVAHPLLQELVRRAPGTYNHSINVASLAESAAEAIGARGLLVRVGAYFHDVGKMLKPAYFVENQGKENRHESLVPAMSTLIIVAHVKEGVELARQYNLPQPIIDLIAEHHGTTLVEYFFRRAEERSQADPNGEEVDEQTYRYPGPKPTTRESAVMMLSDAVESASRTLTEPTPARIANLVHELAMKRLLDGQFDECGLTLEELGIVEQSLVKSLTAVYHGRVKYPDQRTAS
ncbi:MAG: HDIG domain-containing protein [Planctomycetia bacterium]|nr:HDIG domain-containing protein [Planctomycetia bacterium]